MEGQDKGRGKGRDEGRDKGECWAKATGPEYQRWQLNVDLVSKL